MKSPSPIRSLMPFLAACALAMSASFAFAQRGPQLTEDQQAAMQEVNTAVADLNAKVQAATAELGGAMYAEKVDEAQIKAKAAALAKAQEDLAIARAKAFAKVRSKFTADVIDSLKTQPFGRGGRGGGGRRGNQ